MLIGSGLHSIFFIIGSESDAKNIHPSTMPSTATAITTIMIIMSGMPSMPAFLLRPMNLFASKFYPSYLG